MNNFEVKLTNDKITFLLNCDRMYSLDLYIFNNFNIIEEFTSIFREELTQYLENHKLIGQ